MDRNKVITNPKQLVRMELKNAGFDLVDSNLCLGHDSVTYNNGVYEFLSNLQKDGIKNYLISSGLKVFLDKIEIAHFFEKIYATTFNYDENQANIIRLIYAEEYYSAGDYNSGDSLVKLVTAAKNKSKRLKRILDNVNARKKFYKNRPRETSYVYMYK